MPLSEREQQMLEQLERQLHQEDPRLATQLAESPRTAVPVRRIVLGAVLGVAGLAVILWGVSAQLVLVGVLGALLLGAGILVLTGRGKPSDADRPAGSARRSSGGAPAARAGQGTFMDRLEQRWDERRREEP